jgi:RNA polymerase sigma-70 factor (ECF subfamily)
MQIEDPDIRLMLAFRNGDESALSDLYRRWAGPLLRYLERMVRERETAEELLQEAFIRVHGARDRYSPEARFSTWLFRIGRNLALNELDRAHHRMPHLSTDATDADRSSTRPRSSGRCPTLSLVSSEPSALTVLEAKRASTRMEALLVNLPERQRSALWLAAIEGCSYEEIAEILETSIQSVKSLVHRARATLADRMASDAVVTAEVQR